jgi:hypothetical protein
MVPTLELVHRVTDVAVAYTIARMRVLEAIPGNPLGIAIQRRDNVAALMARHLPSPPFNSVVGLRAGQANRIGPLVAWYRAEGVAGRFELTPGDDDPALGRALAKSGYFQSGCHAAFVGERGLGDEVEDHRVEVVSSAEQMEAFLSAYVSGWGIPPAAGESFKRNVRAWLGQPIRRCVGAGCMGRCCAGGRATLLTRVPNLSAAGLIFSPRVIATWSAWACGCCSCARSGRNWANQIESGGVAGEFGGGNFLFAELQPQIVALFGCGTCDGDE